MKDIRNFCIIAHIDHGKSTLADRMLEITDTVRSGGRAQSLDTMDLEQERGITIKLSPARMYRHGYEFNLIDTPGHADFQYEVSRSLAAVEGVVLLVDASQGVQAQTLSTLYMAIDLGLEVIPVLNKIDLPAAEPIRVAKELENLIGIEANEVLHVSAKTGEGVTDVLHAIIERIPSPKKKNDTVLQSEYDAGRTRALIFDSVYDTYKGVVSYVKVLEGKISPKNQFFLIHSQSYLQPTEVGYFNPSYKSNNEINAGQIGYVVTGFRSVRDARIGDTIIDYVGSVKESNLLSYAVQGFSEAIPYVYAGVYPLDQSEYEKTRSSLEKLSLNDSSISYEYENSKALGHGFRCGFLGMLHMDIVKERLRREYGVETIFTIPNVVYLVRMKTENHHSIIAGTNITEIVTHGLYHYLYPERGDIDLEHMTEKHQSLLRSWIVIRSGSEMPDPGDIEEIREPYATVEIVGPNEFTGQIMELAQDYRGEMDAMEYLDEVRVLWRYTMPLGEIVLDFYDRLKGSTKGFATMNYEFNTYIVSDLYRMDILVNNERVEAFSMVLHKEKIYPQGRAITEKLKELIPRHQFSIPIQATQGNKVVARETIGAYRKDVIAKCYGGDVSRKKKLLKRQKEGKKRLKQMGNVSIPGDIFIKMVSR